MLVTIRTKKWVKKRPGGLAHKRFSGWFFLCEYLPMQHAINLCTSIPNDLNVWASLGRCVRAFLKWSVQLTSCGVNKIESSANAAIWLFCGGIANGALVGIPQTFFGWSKHNVSKRKMISVNFNPIYALALYSGVTIGLYCSNLSKLQGW